MAPNNAEEGLGNPTEAPPTASRFPNPVPVSVPPPSVSAGRRGFIISADENDAASLSGNRMIFVELASLILVLSVIVYGAKFNAWDAITWYALSVGLVSLFCCAALRIADAAKPGSLNDPVAYNNDPRLRRQITAMDLVSSFLFFWWVIGAFFITFRGPFVVTSNGYFAAWGGLCATILWIGPTVGEDGAGMVQKMDGRHRSLICLMASSTVVLLASIKYVRSPEGAWGLSCGAVSVIVAATLMAVDRERIDLMLRRAICVFLALLWLAGAGVLTFYGPFKQTGNGYFGSWLGLLCSLWYASYDWAKGEE